MATNGPSKNKIAFFTSAILYGICNMGIVALQDGVKELSIGIFIAAILLGMALTGIGMFITFIGGTDVRNAVVFGLATAACAAVVMFLLSTNVLATLLAFIAGFVSAWLAGQFAKAVVG